jgi:hypothetical protein
MGVAVTVLSHGWRKRAPMDGFTACHRHAHDHRARTTENTQQSTLIQQLAQIDDGSIGAGDIVRHDQ